MAEQLKALPALTKVSRSVLNSIIGVLKLPVNATKRIKYPLHYLWLYTLTNPYVHEETHTHI